MNESEWIFPFYPKMPGKDFSKVLLGGKGAALCEMLSIGVNVPPGFVITTETCKAYNNYPESTINTLMGDDEVPGHMKRLEKEMGFVPLVSIRSGARESMPGMMDTILNVGLTDKTIKVWEKRIGKRAAWDSYRRLISMFGSVVYGIDGSAFETTLSVAKRAAGVKLDTELTVGNLKSLVKDYKLIYEGMGSVFPDNVEDQISAGIEAVFKSWRNERAKTYRAFNGIPEDWGTAVTIQAMVFGNMNDKSGSGVLFTRNPSTGEDMIFGEYLVNAQGEDVVAGTRTPLELSAMTGKVWDPILKKLVTLVGILETHYRDMQDIEFTVMDGRLFILQTRSGKRSANAAFKIAVDMVSDKLITKDEALKRLTPGQFLIVSNPRIDESFKDEPVAVGLPASPGVVTGKVVFDAEAAVNSDEDVILITHETNPDDIAGMDASIGVITATGGATSHAAVVARGMDKPCVTGVGDLEVALKTATIGNIILTTESIVSFDGSTGNIWIGAVPIVDGSGSPEVATVLRWLFEDNDLSVKSAGLIKGERCHVMAVEWVLKDVTFVDAFFADLEKVKDKSEILIDFNKLVRFTRAEDYPLWELFGTYGRNANDPMSDFMKRVKDGSDFHGLNVVLDRRASPVQMKNMKKAGINIVVTPKNMSDLIDSGGPVVLTETFIDDVVGGHKAWTKLKVIMTNGGKPIVTVGGAMSRSEAVFALLGNT